MRSQVKRRVENRPIDSTRAHSAAHRGADDDARAQVVDRMVEVVQIIPLGAYLRVYHRLNRPCASGDATPCTDCPDISEDSEGSTSAGPRLSGRRACCGATDSANVTRHRVRLARCRDHAR